MFVQQSAFMLQEVKKRGLFPNDRKRIAHLAFALCVLGFGLVAVHENSGFCCNERRVSLRQRGPNGNT